MRRERVLEGDSLWSIAAELNRNKVRTVTGGEWRITGLRAVLESPRIAGLSQYRGEVVGKGRWKAIIRPSQSAQLREFFHDPSRRDTAPHSPHLFVAGLLRCAFCGLPLVAIARQGAWCKRRAYGCARRPGRNGCGRISIQGQALEEFVLEKHVGTARQRCSGGAPSPHTDAKPSMAPSTRGSQPSREDARGTRRGRCRHPAD